MMTTEEIKLRCIELALSKANDKFFVLLESIKNSDGSFDMRMVEFPDLADVISEAHKIANFCF